MAIRAAFGGLIAAAILGVGAVGASAAPNPGFGLSGAPVPVYNPTTGSYVTSETNPGPGQNFPYEQTADGPQTSNVPTLAWAGEDVRLVACDNDILANPLSDQGIAFQQAEWNTNLWTGDQAYQSTPTFDGSQATNLYITNTGSASFFFPTGTDERYHSCVSADISSLHAGLDEVTLNVYQQSALVNVERGNSNSPAGGPGLNLDPTPVFSKQFIVIWMTANAPTLTEASQSSIEFPSQADGTPSTATSLGSTTGQLSTLGVENAVTGGGSNPGGLPFLGDGTTPGTFASLDTWGSDTPWDPGAWDGGSNDTPITNNGLVDVKVTGSFPIEDAPPSTTNTAYFHSVTTTGSVTLPNSWVPLANLLATSSTQNTSNNTNPTGGSLWDIHGGPTNPAGHAGTGPNTIAHPTTGICGWDSGPFGQSTDAVDDCVSDGAGDGNAFAFSRVFGDVTTVGGTVGPYDALAPNATLLSDGRLNSDDAPMPALPVTLSIAGNSGNAGDISGIGGLYGVAKYLAYSHDFDASDASPAGSGHPTALTSTGTANLYNPFYQAYIPSTLRPIQEASGVTGVYEGGEAGGSGTDFPGFSLGWTDPYTYWKSFNAATVDTGGDNGCYRSDISSNGGPVGEYQKPDYPTSVTVYTDERGEAMVDYNPGTGWYDNGFTADGNGACDLQALYGKTIGTSTISATTAYPYEAVPYFPPAGANTLTKTVKSEWSKTLTVVPKSNLSPNDISIVIAHAQDVNGEPFAGETVCFTDTPGIGYSFDAQPTALDGTTVVDLTGSAPALSPTLDGAPVFGSNYYCAKTGTAGNVAVELDASGAPSVDVVAVFADEHISRDVTIPALGQTDPVSSTTPPTVLPADKVVLQSGSNGGSGSAGSSSTSSTSAPSATVAPTAPLSIGKGNSCKVASFHLFGKRGYAQLKVSCTESKTDSIVLKAYRANGRLLHTYRLTVKVGKTVTVKLVKKVAHAKVSV
jgi:hypothetical protein